MKFQTAGRRLILSISAILAFASCVDVNDELGGSLIPKDQLYKVVAAEPAPISVELCNAGDLSAFSNTEFVVGSVRENSELGLTRRSSALTLVPLNDEIDLGDNPEAVSFYFAAAIDTFSVADLSQAEIIQNIYVHELDTTIKPNSSFTCGKAIPHHSETVTDGVPVINGSEDSLSFFFKKSFAQKYLDVLKDESHFEMGLDAYLEKLPGIYLETDDPVGDGGRINLFDLQFGYSGSEGFTGNYAKLNFKSTYDGEPKDTSIFFYYSPMRLIKLDSLLNDYSHGGFPQYCVNHSESEGSAVVEGDAGSLIYVEGGSGVKPVVRATEIRRIVRDMIESNGDDPDKAVINRATISMNYIAPDPLFEQMYKYPQMLSPSCKIVTDTTVNYMGLTDASAASENQGDINRSTMSYNPDITYHTQEIIRMPEDNERLLRGDYDIWFLIMRYRSVTTSATASDLNDYYSALAYQNYYNNMYGYDGYGGYGYGGYGYGYGGYGYGGYGSNYYSNYYSYMMAAAYAGGASSSTSTQLGLDKDNYYCARIHGPSSSDEALRPTIRITYSIPQL